MLLFQLTWIELARLREKMGNKGLEEKRLKADLERAETRRQAKAGALSAYNTSHSQLLSVSYESISAIWDLYYITLSRIYWKSLLS